jgi:hypothetical protein
VIAHAALPMLMRNLYILTPRKQQLVDVCGDDKIRGILLVHQELQKTRGAKSAGKSWKLELDRLSCPCVILKASTRCPTRIIFVSRVQAPQFLGSMVSLQTNHIANTQGSPFNLWRLVALFCTN